MQIIPLYRYTRPDSGTTVSPVKPDCEYTEMFRMIADEGMELTDGATTSSCVDTDNVSAWQEVSIQTETELKAQAYDIITGVIE